MWGAKVSLVIVVVVGICAMEDKDFLPTPVFFIKLIGIIALAVLISWIVENEWSEHLKRKKNGMGLGNRHL